MGKIKENSVRWGMPRGMAILYWGGSRKASLTFDLKEVRTWDLRINGRRAFQAEGTAYAEVLR
jgi:hypothetical protein